jgi:8-oxo-dGTP pyrophosphatase MutT (NUDIX family)
MKNATICLLVKGDPVEEVLLGLKKEGFGQGKYVGFGGKIENHEGIKEAAVRELQEEANVIINSEELEHVAHLTFLFPARPEWDHRVYAFLVRSWTGVPQESAEIKPHWFKIQKLPYDQMWADGRHWLPRALSGEKIEATFIYNDDNHSLRDIKIGRQLDSEIFTIP